MKEIKIVLRRDRADRVLRALRDADIARFHVSHVHVLGAGIDPGDVQVSMEEGAHYTDKVKIEVFCRDAEVDGVVRLVRSHAATGQRGDGLIAVTPVERVVAIRTGEEGVPALA